MDRKRFGRMLVAALAGVLVVWAGGCVQLGALAGVERPTASLEGVRLEDVGLEGASFVFDVTVENPNEVGLPLAHLDYKLIRQGAAFLTGEAPLEGEIPAKGSRTLAIPARVGYRELLGALEGVRPGEAVPYEAQAGLTVQAPVVGAIRVPMRREGSFVLPGRGILGSFGP